MELLLAVPFLVFAVLFWPILSYDWPLFFHEDCHCLVMACIAYFWLLSPYHGFRPIIASSRLTSLLYYCFIWWLLLSSYSRSLPTQAILSHFCRLPLDTDYCPWLLSLILLDGLWLSCFYLIMELFSYCHFACRNLASLSSFFIVNDNYLSPTYVVGTWWFYHLSALWISVFLCGLS